MSRHGPLAGGTTWSIAALAALALAGCSGGGSPSVQSAQELPATVAAATVAATTAPPAIPHTIGVRLVIDGQPRDDTVQVGAEGGGDPFGEFASCSGLRSSFGVYQMVISGSEALGGAVQVNSTTNPHEPGPVAASARIETDQATVDVDGTLELSEGFRDGRFLGATASGSRIVVEFNCTSANTPVPIDRTRPYSDVAFLLVRGEQRRVLAFGVPAPCAEGGIEAEIPPEQRPAGGLSRVVIAPDRLELFVNDAPLALSGSSVSVASATTGTFAASAADGANLTGAYSCRA